MSEDVLKELNAKLRAEFLPKKLTTPKYIRVEFSDTVNPTDKIYHGEVIADDNDTEKRCVLCGMYKAHASFDSYHTEWDSCETRPYIQGDPPVILDDDDAAKRCLNCGAYSDEENREEWFEQHICW